MKGAGPAYFTKLIYFLAPRDGGELRNGYIMDQWAGCSVNLLTNCETVLMNVAKTWSRRKVLPVASYTFTVSDANTGANYEAFCSVVDRLKELFSIDVDEVDRALVSTGGKNPETWRTYVKDRRRQFIVTAVRAGQDAP